MTVWESFWEIEWLGAGQKMVATIWLVRLIVRIEVIVIIKQVGTAESKAVIAVVVVLVV